MVRSAAWPGSGQWPWGTTPARRPADLLGRPSWSVPWGVVSYSPCPRLPARVRVCGVCGSMALVHRWYALRAWVWCEGVCAVSVAPWLSSTVGVLCVQVRGGRVCVQCTWLPGYRSPLVCMCCVRVCAVSITPSLSFKTCVHVCDVRARVFFMPAVLWASRFRCVWRVCVSCFFCVCFIFAFCFFKEKNQFSVGVPEKKRKEKVSTHTLI